MVGSLPKNPKSRKLGTYPEDLDGSPKAAHSRNVAFASSSESFRKCVSSSEHYPTTLGLDLRILDVRCL